MKFTFSNVVILAKIEVLMNDLSGTLILPANVRSVSKMFQPLSKFKRSLDAIIAHINVCPEGGS